MIKRTITETIYEYDKDGHLVSKTITETHEEEDSPILNYPSYPYLTNPCTPYNDWWKQPTCNNGTDGPNPNLTTTTTCNLNRDDVVTDTTTTKTDSLFYNF